MPIRITGMNSGLDTEAIIKELASAKLAKKTKMEKAQIKLGWKQDAWKALNTKIYDFYTKTLDDMRWSTSYKKKSITCSNSNAVSIVAGEDAPYSTQMLSVKDLAKSGYMTGGQIKDSSGKEVSGSTTIGDLVSGFSGANIDITLGKGASADTAQITLTATTTIDDVVKQLRSAGVDANFDEKNQRFYINSKGTGEKNDFTLSAVSGDTASAAALEALGLDINTSDADKKAHKVDASDAVIELNGVTYKSENNTFEINGLTITAKEKADDMSITTQADTSGIFDMVKNFFKGYNALINEMDKLYNADSSKGYEPLTDEEKDALSESEAEKWETKIKDSILRKDSTLNDVAGIMKQVMSQGVEVGAKRDSEGKIIEGTGTKMYLFDFGIDTLGYFNAPDNERNAYHIDGDSDDSNTGRNENKLMAAIMADPDKVTDFFTGLANNLSQALFDKMKAVEGVSSAFCVYEDKLMKEEYDEYTTKIEQQQKRVDAFMDKYYAKFSAMETALAKLESKSNAVAQLLGM